MSNSMLSDAGESLDVLDQVIIVFLVVDRVGRLNRNFVTLAVAEHFNFGAQFKHVGLEVLRLKEFVQFFWVMFAQLANFLGCFS